MIALFFLVALAGLGLALANGANDNGKPVATLIGSGALTSHQGLAWGFWTTLAGSLFALFWGAALLKSFSGQGLVAAQVMANPAFLPSVALAAAGTVALATRLSLPVSTTHALLGGLVGAGLVLGHGQIAWSVVGGKLAGPLLLSPILALAATWVLTPLIRALAPAAGTSDCACVGACAPVVSSDGVLLMTSGVALQVGTYPECKPERGFVLWPPRALALRGLHVLSSGAVSFARGLNDTPKIAAVLLPLAIFGKSGAIVSVALAMGIGGWFLAKGVTTTMSQKITHLEGREPDALAGNLATAFLVLLASRWGVPVSTTHVATGALVGAGASRGEFQTKTLARILTAWVTTLPLAAALAALLVIALGGLK